MKQGKITKLLLAVFIAGGLSACGNSNLGSRQFDDSNFDFSGFGGSENSSEVVTSTGNNPMQVLVQATGYTATTVKVQTHSKLKVRFQPGTQISEVQGTGFSPEYSKMGVYVKVGGVDQATPLLYNGLFGGSAQKSQIIDLSGGFTHCSDDEPGCRVEVTITVHKPNYDYWCLKGLVYECPYTYVWSTHPWNGILMIETDDTDAL